MRRSRSGCLAVAVVAVLLVAPGPSVARWLQPRPQFVRSSVESVPDHDAPQYAETSPWEVFSGERSSPLKELPFGSRSLPLREAVEHEPTAIDKAKFRTPLRDAVEFRPPPPTRQLDEFVIDEPLVRETIRAPSRPSERLAAPSVRPATPTDGSHKVVCYWEAWAVYRKQGAEFRDEDIDPWSCTHLIYSFASVDVHTLHMEPHDDEYDIVKGGYRAAVGLKRRNPALRVLLSVGGRIDGDPAASVHLSFIAARPERRREFIESVVFLLKEHGFDGLEVHWPLPGAQEFGGSAADRENLALLLEELAKVLNRNDLILSAAVAATRYRIDDGFDVPRVAAAVDFLTVSAMDFHTERGAVAENHAPLKSRFGDWEKGVDGFLNAQYSVNYWIKKGASPSKLVLAVPFYGRSFTLRSSDNEPGAAIRGLGREGPYTQTKGLLAYFEICELLAQPGWTAKADRAGSPFMVKDDQWVGYDNPESIAKKMQFIRDNKLAGAAVWAIDFDDFSGQCGKRWPLLSAVNQNLNRYPVDEIVSSAPLQLVQDPSPVGTKQRGSAPVKPLVLQASANSPGQSLGPDRMATAVCARAGANSLVPDTVDCSSYIWCVAGRGVRMACERGQYFSPIVGLCVYGDPRIICPWLNEPVDKDDQAANLKITNQNDLIGEDNFKLVCSVASWASYRKGDGKFVPEHLDFRLCSHVVYDFAALEPESLAIQPSDPWLDTEHDLYDRLTALPDPRLTQTLSKEDKVKVMLALGGWTDSAGDKYSRLVSSESARQRFVTGVVSFLKLHHFKGLELDWTYPRCWQADCKRGPESDKPNFTKLVKELHDAFSKQKPPLSLAISISGYKEIIEKAYELDKLAPLVEYISVMTYDYHGAWERKLGHVSPLYFRLGDRNPYYNTNSTMDLIASMGVPREKLLVGLPFYGQTFRAKSSDGLSLGDPADGLGEPGEFTTQPGMLAYYEICDRVKNKQWTVGKDPLGATGPFIYKGEQWASYDDLDSMKAKAHYIKNMGFGGATATTVDLDDFANRCCREPFPLLRAVARILGRLDDEEPTPGCARPPAPVTPPPPTLTTAVDSGDGEYHPTTPSTTWPSWTEGSSTTAGWRPPSTTPSKPRPTTPKPSTTSKPSSTSSTSTSTTTTTESSSSGGSGPEPGAPCNAGEYMSDPVNCNAYYRCILGELRREYCAGGLHWNKDRKICDWPTEDGCRPAGVTSPPATSTTKKPPKSTTTSTTSTTTTSTTTPSTTTSEKTTVTWWPTSSTTTTSTTSSTWWPTSSTTTTSTTASTWWPTTTSTTTTSTTPSTTSNEWWTPPSTSARPDQWWTHPTTEGNKEQTTSTTSSSEAPDSEVVSEGGTSDGCVNGQYYPAPGACNNFYICVNGMLVKQKCAHGLVWNQDRSMCDWMFNVKCAQDISIMRKEPPCVEGTLEAVKGSCRKYNLCVHGEFVEFSCPNGLHFNPDKKVCDWPSGCVDTEGPGTTNAPGTTPPDGVEITTSPSQKPPSTQPPTTTPAAPEGPRPPMADYFKIVCYFTNWAWYRQGIGKYRPEDIDADLCTHIVYGFAVLDYENLIIKAHDSWADFDNHFYEKVIEYKKKGKKVSLAIGGWNDSAGDKYSRLVNNPTARRRFIKHVIEFLERYGFDGLDLDWEYPKCWQTNCEKGPASDKQAFADFVKELKGEFAPKGLLLSSAVSPSKRVIDNGYDVPALAQALDWIAVMTYDYHGQWDMKTGHVAPLFFHPDDEFYYFNTNYTIHYWIDQGAPRRKLVMGMPLYGQAFQLAEASTNGLNARATGPGQAGEFTRAAGFLAYYEICDNIKSKGWTVVQDPKGRMGPYAVSGNQWVGFDDPAMIEKKSQYIRDMDLGGGMVWALDLDDFRNRCGQGRHPLLGKIRNSLASARGQSPKDLKTPGPTPQEYEPVQPTDAPAPGSATTPGATKQPPSSQATTPTTKPTTSPPAGTSTVEPTTAATVAPTTTTSPSKDSWFKVVCYFTNWAWYRQGKGKYLPSDIDSSLCTHIVYGFAVLDGDTLTIKPHDSWADIDNGFYAKVVALKKKGVKVSLAIGGWNDSAGDKYSRLVNNPAARARFVETVVQFVEKYEFDGLDLDWEYPKCWQVNCKQGPASDKPSFSAFVKELKAAFAPKGLLLSSAVSPNKAVIDAGYDVPVLSENLDWIAVMAYDYHGQWDKKTGHVAPMYAHPDDTDQTFNANFSINYWIQSGADRRKIVMGMPTYGQSFSLADTTNHGLNAPTYGGGEAGDSTRARGFLSYYEICERTRKKGWTVVRDPTGSMGPYAYKGDQWVSFDDADTIRKKTEWIRLRGLGGGMIWALDLDDFTNTCECETYPLLKVINRELGTVNTTDPQCKVTEGYSGKDEVSVSGEDMSSQKPAVEEGDTNVIDAGDNSSEEEVVEAEPIDVPCGSLGPAASGRTALVDGVRYVPSRKDCNKYFTCQFGQLVVQSCPAGLYWNKDHCDWPQNTDCGKQKPTEKPQIPVEPAVTQESSQPPSSSSQQPEELTTASPPSEVTPDTSKPVIRESNKVVCYFTNWAWYRNGIGKYTPDNIDSDLCTHIVYGFAVLDGSTLTIKPHDTWADIDNNFYRKVVAFKKKGIRVSLAIGGWNDSAGDKYSRLVNDPAARKRFVEHVVKYLKQYDFDGLDFDWEYPKCWQVNCQLGPASDKQGFASIVKELREAFRPHGLLLSAAVSPSKVVVDEAYEVPVLSENLDWIAVMTYDYHGNWDGQTGHVAPLYYTPGDTYDYFNANFSMHYWIQKGAAKSKLVMGMPLYGQSFTLASSANHGLNAKSQGPGQAGTYTRAAGFLAFYEICDNVKKQGWQVVRDDQGRIGPYAFKDNQWVGYDDVQDLTRKSKFIKELGLAGGMIWALDLDDFTNSCGCGPHPLLHAINRELRGIPGTGSDCT